MTTSQDFEKYHQDNPGVYAQIVRDAREWKRTVGQRVGMSVFIGRVRWTGRVENEGADFRINDHYGPYYARLVMAQERDLFGLFDMRVTQGADAWICEKFPNSLVAEQVRYNQAHYFEKAA